MAAEDKKSGESFLSRWSRRKVEVAKAAATGTPDVAAQAVADAQIENANPSIGAASGAKMPEEARPEPTLPSAAEATRPELPALESLTHDSSFAPFMRADVAPALRNQAMKKLFTDPHYNVMDRLDIYIDDYSQPDPIPPAMLRMMNQSKTLGLFEEEERAEEAARRAAGGEASGEAESKLESKAEGNAGGNAKSETPPATPDAASTSPAATADAGPASAAVAPAAEAASFPFAPQPSA